ncbi:hypothetical protein CRM22_003259 [Opisthorchis felineus]|uniref:N-acetylgalactosaminide beta-1,3-galactosyltransferase n=1 Tax=Opisthorchis felineus TaxID=147828 RepID=A0A4S2M2N6_OPIFE|nr:hypothetical protein CRM22_003259 [Opisthorchis felineus]
MPRCTLRANLCFLTGILTGVILQQLIKMYRPVCNKSPILIKVDPDNILKEQERVYVIDASIALETKSLAKILCYINTYPATHLSRALHVKLTWARKCNRHLFMSSGVDKELGAVKLNLLHNESRQHLWSKMQAILRHVNQYRDEYDYFYKSDDDAYVVSENLRTALTHLQPNDLFFAGYPFYHELQEGHLSGGPGYVISREAFKTIMDKVIGNHPACPTYDENKEDVKMTMCGNAVGVKLVHLVDRHTTFPYTWRPERRTEYLFQWRGLRRLLNHRFRHKSYQVAPAFDINNPFVREDRNLLSAALISTHYESATMMYILEFGLYHLRPAGIVNRF